MARKRIRIHHGPSGTLLAEGPLGWGITPFEGNYYISRKHLATRGFRFGYLPGFCIYKFFYLRLDFVPANGQRVKGLGWMYVLPNPLFPFIAFRVAIPGHRSDILIEKVDARSSTGVDDSNRHPAPLD